MIAPVVVVQRVPEEVGHQVEEEAAEGEGGPQRGSGLVGDAAAVAGQLQRGEDLRGGEAEPEQHR